MTWARIEPFSAAASRAQPVTISTSGGPGERRNRPTMTITVRRDQLPGLTILQRGTGCQALLGTGENAGQIRLHAGGDFTAKAPTGKKTVADTVSIRIPMPAGIEAMKRTPVAVEHDYQASWLVLTLPQWGQPAPAAPARTPHKSIMDRVPDPAAPLRGAR